MGRIHKVLVHEWQVDPEVPLLADVGRNQGVEEEIVLRIAGIAELGVADLFLHVEQTPGDIAADPFEAHAGTSA